MSWGRMIGERIVASRDLPFLLDAASGRHWTFGEFHEKAKSGAAELARRGLPRGSRVVLLLPNGPDFPLLYFACLYAGVMAMPVNQALHPRQLGVLLRLASAPVVIHAEATRSALTDALAAEPEVQITPWCLAPEELWHLPPSPVSDGEIFAAIADDQLFSTSFTSGTTGQPKGVCHRVDGLFSAAQSFAEAVGLGPEDRLLHVLPMSYMAGFLNTLLCPFIAGAGVVLDRAFDARLSLGFWKTPRAHGVTALWLVPSILASLLKMDRDAEGQGWCRQNIRLLCVGTAPLPATLQQAFEARYGVPLLESYGLSETLFVSSNTLASPRTAGSVGPLLEGVKVRAVDESGADVPEGELWVQAAFNMAGYWNPAALAPDLLPRDTWFPTGDIGRLAPNGELFITARKKDLIIRGGLNISPRAVEEGLLEHPAVEAAAVVGLPHEYYGEQVVAWLVLKPGEDFAAVKPVLLSHCRAQLGAAMTPDQFLATEQFPMGVTGKIQKDELRRQAAAALAS